MFLIDKYKKYSEGVEYHKEIIDRLLNSPDKRKEHYINTDELKKKDNIDDFISYVNNEVSNDNSYTNFPHILLYGPPGTGKGNLVNMLLERIYDKSVHQIKEVKYTVLGYGNTKTKVDIRQSNYHIIIEPNNNGFDKYLIQEIVQEYARRQMLNIFKTKKKFKVVLIDCVDNLSYYAQASLRRTMEKYVNNCKFILINHQLSKVIEPIRSRCLCVRVSLPKTETVFESLFKIANKEKLNLSLKEYNSIVKNSDNQIGKAIWLLQLHQFKIKHHVFWTDYIDKIINIIFEINSKMSKTKYYNNMMKVRNLLYTIFITNINTQVIIKELMNRLLLKVKSLDLKSKIIEISSAYECRLTLGKRHIIHLEAYVNTIIYILNININKKKSKKLIK